LLGLIETGRGVRHMLVIPRITFDDGDVGLLTAREDQNAE
jgi:hypothetical protein